MSEAVGNIAPSLAGISLITAGIAATAGYSAKRIINENILKRV